jgi:hypothetical protein
MATSKRPAVTPIEVRVESVSQLFDTLDPFPFPERDLDKDAEEYIVGWARELPHHQRIEIVIHLPRKEVQRHDAKTLTGSFRRYFEYRTVMLAREQKELFRIGRIALVIGLSVLAVCLMAGRLLVAWLGESGFMRFFMESLVIVGWVANWKPIEIFLYDWWPLMRRRNLYRRLAMAEVRLQPYE